MAIPKDRDEEANVRILLESVRVTDWGLRASTRVTDRRSYQSLISALNASQRDLNLHAAAKTKTYTAEPSNFFRRSLWTNGNEQKERTNDPLFNDQGRFGRHPRSIDRTRKRHNNQRKYFPKKPFGKCFNCERYGCSLSTCKAPKDQYRIDINMEEWKRQRGYGSRTRRVSIAELNLMGREEAAEIMYAERYVETDEDDIYSVEFNGVE